MANEINIQASVTYQRYTDSILQEAAALNISQAASSNKASIINVQLVGTGSEALQLGDVNTGPNATEALFYLFVKNLGPTNYLELSTDDFAKIFAKLRVNEFCLVPIAQTHNQLAVTYARANTAAVAALVMAVSP